MFDTTTNNNFRYNVNAVSGTLRKSHPKSKLCVRPVDKNLLIFDPQKPRLSNYEPEIIVLQAMLTGENNLLVEYVLKTDFEEDEGDG